MGRISTVRKSVYIFTGAAFACVFIATIALNALREYDEVRPIEFMIVPLCALFAAIDLRKNGVEGAIVLGALCLTACADFIMVLLKDYYTLSLAFFSAAQLTYYARILFSRTESGKGKRYFIASVSARAATSVCVCFAATLVLPHEKLLAALAAFYFINLAANFIEACLTCVHKTRGEARNIKLSLLFAAGLALFMCCDICVALNAADTAGIELPEDALYAVNLLIWIFYAPSQALLALSAKRNLIDARRSSAARSTTG